MVAKSLPDEPEPLHLLPAALVLAATVLALFGEFLFGDGGTIPSSFRSDAAKYYVYAREFAAQQILQGNIPLWNPHTFSGTPFVGVFQPSVFYPLNAVYLMLPLERALSLEPALSLFLLGVFFYLWLRNRGLHAAAALFAAVTLMLSGPCILRVLAGAFTVLGVFAWMPLLLLSIDRLADRGSPRWIAVGVAAVSMMILAGHPPTVFMALVTTVLYGLPALWRSHERWRLAGGLAVVAVAPLFVTAIQLWPGLEVAGEATRRSGMSFDFATSFSFPPESLLTLLTPNFFGDEVRYFGRWFYWDASAYLGVVSLVFVVHGSLVGRGDLHRRALGVLAVLVLLSLGRYTPLYQIFFDVVPGFAYLRAPSKFMFFAAMFAAALAGIGVDRLLRHPARLERTAVAALALGTVAALLALGVWGSRRGVDFASPILWLSPITEQERLSPMRLAVWHDQLFRGLVISAGLAVGMAVLFWIARRRREAVWALLALGALELLVFARQNVGSIEMEGPWMTPTRGLLALYERAGDHRVLSIDNRPNAALVHGGLNVWGYDPLVLRRYLEFIALTQRTTADALDNVEGDPPRYGHALLTMLRTKYKITAWGKVTEYSRTMPRLVLKKRYRVLAGPDAVLAAMNVPGFDPGRAVLLEQEPVPRPKPGGGAGLIELRGESTDHLEIEVETATPALLLVTDSYSTGWRAVALPGSVQHDYQVLPANAVLRAVPLEAGRHRLRLEYSPWGFRAGRWATLASLALGLAFVGWSSWRPRRV